MQSDYSRMRETTFDLYTERDQISWYLKTTTVLLSWLALGGYVLFALIFTSDDNNLTVSRTGLTVVAATLLVLGYAGAAAATFFSHSLLFTFDAVLLPFLASSFMGGFVVVMNRWLLHEIPPSNNAVLLVPLITATLTTVAFGVSALLVNRKLGKIKARDIRTRQKVSRWERLSGRGDPASTTELMPMEIPEDEAQRQQLLRLLFQREAEAVPSPDGGSSTYRISLPGEEQNTSGKYLIVPPSRARAGSLSDVGNRWNMSNLLGRSRSPSVESFSTPREQRRQEIERQSLTSTPQPELYFPPPPTGR